MEEMGDEFHRIIRPFINHKYDLMCYEFELNSTVSATQRPSRRRRCMHGDLSDYSCKCFRIGNQHTFHVMVPLALYFFFYESPKIMPKFWTYQEE